ncbi:hypothetical protein SAY86_030875 [Trapa natans]|uniref:Uncharacterized protein n=1 Tax=Trapa natans TaxID=22666 RepID=A0AAN7M4G0_TRANT|nr:hypothetical protein SAY86_030875 [Trapa natans]
MKESSQVILGATLIMAASLAIVLGLIFVLLAELYCSLLHRSRRPHQPQQLCDPPPPPSSATFLSTISATAPTLSSSVNPSTTPSPLSSFYAHGVLHAPRSLLFPALPSPSAPEKRHYLLSEELFEAVSSHRSFTPLSLPGSPRHQLGTDKSSHLVYISNPIYFNGAAKTLKGQLPHNNPFENPGGSSPSDLDSGNYSGADDEADEPPFTIPLAAAYTPTLTTMKKLQAEVCSVPLRGAGSLCTSRCVPNGNTNQGLLCSSSSGTPCSSPSW